MSGRCWLVVQVLWSTLLLLLSPRTASRWDCCWRIDCFRFLRCVLVVFCVLIRTVRGRGFPKNFCTFWDFVGYPFCSCSCRSNRPVLTVFIWWWLLFSFFCVFVSLLFWWRLWLLFCFRPGRCWSFTYLLQAFALLFLILSCAVSSVISTRWSSIACDRSAFGREEFTSS